MKIPRPCFESALLYVLMALAGGVMSLTSAIETVRDLLKSPFA